MVRVRNRAIGTTEQVAMDRNMAVKMAQDAIKAQNKRLVDQVLELKAQLSARYA